MAIPSLLGSKYAKCASAQTIRINTCILRTILRAPQSNGGEIVVTDPVVVNESKTQSTGIESPNTVGDGGFVRPTT